MKLVLSILIILLGTILMAEENLKWIDAHELGVSGKENYKTFNRFSDADYQKILDAKMENVQWLALNTAGMHIDFTTDASEIYIQFELLDPNVMYHMASTGSAGFDMYIKQKNKWRYYSTANFDYKKPVNTCPMFLRKEAVLLNDQKELTFSLNFPLYNGLKSLKIGVNPEATIKPITYWDEKPIIIYGSSITQGGCASRPGMAYTNILRREIDRDVYNLGFSGSGLLEHTITDILCQKDPEIMVMDCVSNMRQLDEETFIERFNYFYDNFRKAHPTTPILFMEKPTFPGAWAKDVNIPKNDLLSKLYKKWKKNDKNIYYIKSKDLYGKDLEAAVDGVHATDLGFYRMSIPVNKTVKKILGL